MVMRAIDPETGMEYELEPEEKAQLLKAQREARQAEILHLRTAGYLWHEIADRLGISERTAIREWSRLNATAK